MTREHSVPEHVRVAVVGSGFAGIGASVALQRAGVDHVVLERAEVVGGTWRDNTYPGCRCDVPSHLYSFSFAPNPEWRETYAPQPEIQAYLRHTADRFGVTARTRFGHDVLDATWHDDEQRWHLHTSAADLTADVLVLGNGPLAEPRVPDLPGVEQFGGQSFHSARWPASADLAGRHVAVIGTGASAIQLVPAIQPDAASVTVFQRTPPWVLPHRNRRITAVERAVYRRLPIVQRFVRGQVYWSRELFARALLTNGPVLAALERLARRHVQRHIADPELRAKVIPSYRPGCKRLLPSDDWYRALAAPNVTLVTDAVSGVRPDGVVTASGGVHRADTIVWATGFRVTDNPILSRVRGRTGRTLTERFAGAGMRAYLGTAVPEFPNLFVLAGPNTGIGHTSLVVMIEAQLAYLVDALRVMDRHGAASVELREPVLAAWDAEMERKAAPTVWTSGGCASWYLDAAGRNTTIWPDHTYRFRRRARQFDAACYHLRGRDEPGSPARLDASGTDTATTATTATTVTAATAATAVSS